jgi:uncharacterized protein
MKEQYYLFVSDEETFIFERNSASIIFASPNMSLALKEYLALTNIPVLDPYEQNLQAEIQSLLGELCEGKLEPRKALDPEYIEINLMVSNDCNLRCRYCFARDVFMERFRGKMSPEIARSAVDMFLASEILTSVIFMGGEPTLARHLIESTVEYVIDRCSSLQLKVPKFPVVTNAVAIDGDFLDFVTKHNMQLIVSYDGPECVHDLNRVFESGTGSHDIVRSNIQMIRDRQIPFLIEATYTKQHLENGISVKDLFKTLSQFGADSIYIMPVGHKDKTIGFSDQDGHRLFDLFREAATYAVTLDVDNQPTYSYPRSVMSAFGARTLRTRMCDAGINSFTIMPEGSVFPCYFLSQESMRMVHLESSGEVLASELVRYGRALLDGNRKENYAECRACWAANLCFGCYGPAIQEHMIASPPPRYFCSVLRGLVFGTIVGLVRQGKAKKKAADQSS